MLYRYIQKEPEVVKYIRSSSVYRDQLKQWFDDESPYQGNLGNNQKKASGHNDERNKGQPQQRQNQQEKRQGGGQGRRKQQKSDDDGNDEERDYQSESPKSQGQFIQGQAKITINETSEIHFYELILKLERLYLEMQRYEVFEMPKICHPLLLHAYLLGIKNTSPEQNGISVSISMNIIYNKVLQKYFESDVYLKKYLEAQLYPQENQPSVTQLIEMFTNSLYQQEFLQKNLNEVDVQLVTKDYNSYGLIDIRSEQFILGIINKDKNDPQVKDYLTHFPLSWLGNNILVAQLKICFNSNQCIRIPIFTETAWFDVKLIAETSKQTIQGKVDVSKEYTQNSHSESALIGRMHEDLFINNGVLIIRGLEQSIEIKNISYISSFELEIASMRAICKECRTLLNSDNFKYTNELQVKIKEINQKFEITKNLPLYKRAMFMQFDDKNAPDAMNIEQPIFRQESIPLGLFSRYMFKYRYLKKQALENYKGDIKTPIEQIQLSHTYYLSASNSSEVKTYDFLLKEAVKNAEAQEQADILKIKQKIQQEAKQEQRIELEANEDQISLVKQMQEGQKIQTEPFVQKLHIIETEQSKKTKISQQIDNLEQIAPKYEIINKREQKKIEKQQRKLLAIARSQQPQQEIVSAEQDQSQSSKKSNRSQMGAIEAELLNYKIKEIINKFNIQK